MDLLNKETKEFEDAKDFVLHNCYKDTEGSSCHSEVSPFAIYSYTKYPFFYKYKYHAYYPRYTYRPFYENNKFIEINLDNCFLTGGFPVNKKLVNGKNIRISSRRQVSSTNYGCFISKDLHQSANKEEAEWMSIDIAGDIITSIKNPLNIYLDFKLSNKDVNNLQIGDFSCIKSSFKKSLFNAVTNFCKVVGTIGNMMPIPEHTNPAGNKCDNYYKKLNNYKDIFSYNSNNSFKAIKQILSQKNNVDLKNNASWEDKCSYALFIDLNYTKKDYQAFINDFYLQDYFVHFDNKNLIKPCNDCEDNGYPSKEATIEDWIDWFNCNTCLILKRGARIYTEGCGEKDNEKKNKARKELAWKLISDEIFNLGEWYKTNGIRLGLEPLS